MPDFYPSAKCELLIRFEEYKRFDKVDAQKPAVPTKNLKGNSDNRAPLVPRPDPDAPAGVTRYVLVDKNNQAPAKLASNWQNSDRLGLTHRVGGVIPKSASWQQSGFRKGDTLKLTFRYADMPLDPRVIRAAGVRFYLGNVAPPDFAAGIMGNSRANEKGRSETLNLVPNTYFDKNRQFRSNLRFIGWINTWAFTADDSAEPMVELECQDNTTLFINQPAPPQLSLNGDLPIDEAVAAYLAHFAQFEGAGVEYRPHGGKKPKLSQVLANTAFKPSVGPPISQGAGSGGDSGNSTTVWDYLTDCCGYIGHMIHVDVVDDAAVVVIQETINVFNGKRERRADDPYQGREVDGKRFEQRVMVFGTNVLSMKGKHEYTRKSISGIEVRSYSGERKNILVARFPDKGDRPSRVLPGDKVDDKWLVRHVHGVKDADTLKAIARNYFNVVGRNELEWEIKTRDLCSYGGDGSDPDLLDMRAGDAFEVAIDRGDQHVITSLEKHLTAFASGGEYMRDQLGFSEGFSAAYTEAYTNAGFQNLFKLKEMSVDWDIDGGVDVTLKGINFIEVRADPSKFTGDVRPTNNREVTKSSQLTPTQDEGDARRLRLETTTQSGRLKVGA